jgi:hypothetical protein
MHLRSFPILSNDPFCWAPHFSVEDPSNCPNKPGSARMGSLGTIYEFLSKGPAEESVRREITLFIALKETCQWKVLLNFVSVLQAARFSAVSADCRRMSGFFGDCNFRFLVWPTNRKKRIVSVWFICIRC